MGSNKAGKVDGGIIALRIIFWGPNLGENGAEPRKLHDALMIV